MRNKRSDRALTGLFLILVGGLFLATNMGWLALRWEIVWPALIIIVGIWFVLRALMTSNNPPS